MRLTSAAEARDTLRRWRETTRRTSPVGADVPALPPDINPTRRTDAGLGHAPTSPISGARALALPPIPGVPPLVPGPLPGPLPASISGYTPVATAGGSGAHAAAHTGGETRRTQPQVALADPPLPPIPAPGGSSRRPSRCPPGRRRRPAPPPARTPWRPPAARAGAGDSAASSAPPCSGSSSGARGRSAARCGCGTSPTCSDARSTRPSPRRSTRWSRPTAR